MSTRSAHAEGVAFVEALAADFVSEPVDIAITSSAGFPLDLTYYQSIKGLTAISPIVKKGGTILIAARCEEGIGSGEFENLILETPSVPAFLERLKDPDLFAIDQWQLQELCKVLDKAEVMFFSEGIGAEYKGKLLVDLIPSMKEGLEQALLRYGADARIAVVPKGPYVITRIREKN